MNEVEAMKIMKYNKRLLGLPDQGEAWRENSNTIACDLAISALEKQIPKKIDHDYLSCNSCDGDLEVFVRMDIVHCPWCGQRLDFSEEKI